MRARRFGFLRWSGFGFALLVLCLAQTAGAQHLPQYYEVTEIRIPGSTSTSYVVDINDQQLAVLYSSGRGALYDGNINAFTVLDIGYLPGYSYTEPYAINNAGEVAGNANTQSSIGRAFLYRNGAMMDLGLLPAGLESGASDLNDAGTAIGWSYQNTGEQNAVQFSGGTVTRIAPPTPYDTNPVSVNNFGVAVGSAPWPTDSWLPHAVIFRNGTMTDLGPPGHFSEAVAINDSEGIAGNEMPYSGSFWRSFITSPGGYKTYLGALPGFASTRAYAMNNYGMVVGGSSNNPWTTIQERAFVYGDCRIVDLTNMIHPASPLKPYVTLAQAKAINNNGWILAQGRDSRDWYVWRAYILKPVGPPEDICT